MSVVDCWKATTIVSLFGRNDSSISNWLKANDLPICREPLTIITSSVALSNSSCHATCIGSWVVDHAGIGWNVNQVISLIACLEMVMDRCSWDEFFSELATSGVSDCLWSLWE